MNQLSEFENKVVLVTGAGRGLGRAIAEAFAAGGAVVAANDITPINLDETLRRIQASGGRAKDYIYDVAKKMPIQAMVSQVLEDWGRIDVLVNNAGVEPHVPILEMDEWDWLRTLDVNLGGPFFAMQLAGRAMRLQGGGVIVNLASTRRELAGTEGRAAFVASKMGLIGLTRQAALEFSPYHIRVNAVCPDWSGQASPQQVAEMVLYLCSQAASSINGQSIEVDDLNHRII